MFLIARCDSFGNAQHLTSKRLRRILDLLDTYMAGKKYDILEIRQENVKDPVERIDIEVAFVDENNHLMGQKLLILNDELIDGLTFHKRFDEWYGDK